MPIISITEVYDYLRLKTGAYWLAAGERTSDSIVRNAMIKNSGSIDRQRGRFYPIAYWTKRNVLDYIKTKKLKLPVDSQKLGFSFCSLEGRELAMVKKVYPDDYERIKRVFPYCGAAVERWRRYHDGE